MTTADGAGGAGLAAVQGGAPASARVPLTRKRIVAAAVEFVDEHGLAQLTMRRLGMLLGVEAMSMYRYVPSREDLLDGIVQHLMDEVRDDADVARSQPTGWPDFLQRLAHRIRRVALRHPAAFPLVASRPPEAPWLRPPLRSLEWVELFLSRLQAEGFSDEAAVAAYRGFSSFLLGHLLLEVASRGADVGSLSILTSDAPSPGLADYPLVSRLAPALAEDHAAVEFDDSLENLLGRLALLL